MANINMVVHGLKETQADLTKKLKDMEGPPIAEAMRDAVLIVQRDARRAAPVNYGQLRASILPSVSAKGNSVTGVVGSNVAHAPSMEYGTKPHWPPLAVLETWARRHGTTAYLVARAIARHGIKARYFLRNAFEDNRDRITTKFEMAVKRVIEG
jgi:hypothetical protein